jgi:anti-anti-sigma factor
MTALSVPPFERIWGPDSLTVTVLRSDQTRASLRAVGDLDMTGADVLSAALAGQRELGRRFVRLDLTDVTFLDTAGVRALAGEHVAFLRTRGTLIIAGLTARARRLLEMVGLDRELLILEPFAEVPTPLTVVR